MAAPMIMDDQAQDNRPAIVDELAPNTDGYGGPSGPITQYQPVRQAPSRIVSSPLALSPPRSPSLASSDGIVPTHCLPDYASLARSGAESTLHEYVAPNTMDTGRDTAWEVQELRERLRNEERDAADNLSLAREALEHRGTLVQELHSAEALADAYAERMQGG